MDLKYVMFDYYTPVLFLAVITHAEMKNFRSECFSEGKITSAGFVQVTMGDDNGITAMVYGESDSLKLKSNPKDSIIITRMLRRE